MPFFSPPVYFSVHRMALEAASKVIPLCGWDLERDDSSIGSCVGQDSWKVASEHGQEFCLGFHFGSWMPT